jgi:hypothetical protein
MTLESIHYAFKSVFSHANSSDLKQLLSILVAADFVRCGGTDQQYFLINRNSKPFMDFEQFVRITFRLELAEFYQDNFPAIAAEVGKL